ncbi:unnamed protein product [Heterobilharzia americana]|nr:unnamed protein product [Heterobilharzia americana]CAH8464902.1 unnamed protein product [Heterobilharzia americana]
MWWLTHLVARYKKRFQQTTADYINSCHLRSLNTDTEDQIDGERERAARNSLWPPNEPTENPSPNKYAEESGAGLDFTHSEKTVGDIMFQAVEWKWNGKRRVVLPR